ncbi:MAG: sulfite exporter TauE/SafE family protein [Candidatus Magasanikbacteria bacterium]
MQEKIYHITGMHCASCELLIEKRVLKEEGVKVVDASLGNGTLRIESDGRVPKVKDLNAWFKNDQYSFSETKEAEVREPLLYVQEGKGVQVNKKILKRKLSVLVKIAVVFFALFLIERSGAVGYVSVGVNSSLGLFFLFGIVAGLSSCAALVGGILLSLTKGWNDQYGFDAPMKTKMIPHVYFHVGRLFAYGFLGGLLGALGKAVAFENVTIYAAITIGVSLVMLIIGLQMAGVKWAERFQIRMPKFVTRRVAGNSTKQGKRLPFAIGAGTIVLPCGFTLIVQGIALTSGSAVSGALMLMVFVLGTVIPLLFIGVASIKGSENPKRGRVFSFYAGVVLVIFALYNVNGQMNVLGLKSVSDLFAGDLPTEKTEVNQVLDSNGEQVVSLVAKGFSYKLTSPATIQAGVPTKLIVDDQGMQGCGVFLAARGLIDGFVDLKLGENVIDLGKPKKGTYKITCSMGMVPPVTIRVQ